MGQRFISKCIAARVCFEEAITSGGSAINRGYSLPDSCTVPLSNAIDKKFHGRRPAKRAKMVDSPRTDIRWRFMFHAPLFTTSRHGRSQKFSASGTNKNSISSVTLTRSIHLRPARLSLSLSLSAKLNWNEGEDVSIPYRVEKQFVGISVGLIEYILGKRASHRITERYFIPELTNLRVENWKHCYYHWIVADEVIEFFNRIISVFVDLLLGNN